MIEMPDLRHLPATSVPNERYATVIMSVTSVLRYRSISFATSSLLKRELHSLERYEETAGGGPRRERLGPTPSSARRR